MAVTTHTPTALAERGSFEKLHEKTPHNERQDDGQCLMFIGSRDEFQATIENEKLFRTKTKMTTFVKEAGDPQKHLVTDKEVVGNIGTLKSERKNVRRVQATGKYAD